MTDLTELYKILEFDKILAAIKNLTLSEMARDKFDVLEFLTNKNSISKVLTEVSEFTAILRYDDPFPLYELPDIRKDLEAAAVEGNFLPIAAFIRIIHILSASRQVHFYLKKRKEEYPNLWNIAENIRLYKAVEDEISQKVDFQAVDLKDSASPKLNHIRKEISRIEQRVRQTLDRLFKSYSQKGYLQDELVTLKDGRLVFPVKLEHRGRIKGLVQDQSASGSTLFIEPLESVELNNEIRSLKAEETREKERILRELTSLLRKEIEGIIQNLSILIQFDVIQAKARFAKKLNCVQPQLNGSNHIEISAGRHPLLVLHKKEHEKVVPLDLKIDENFNTLVITGPNAGGKSVTLKTVGLLTLMMQSGIPVSAHPDSNLAIFEKIFVDIGDFQSIEQDLSTFSSHINKMKRILQDANSKSLVLVDEIGVGTDPDEGAALAVAFLEELTTRGGITIVTTHHGALKAFAYETPRVENGSMEFDIETLQPLYKFRLGIPGSSYAIEISSRLGIPESVLSRSRNLLGSEKVKLERLIIELEKKIQQSNKFTEQLTGEKKRLEHLSGLYKEKYEGLKAKESSLKERALEEAQQIVGESNAALERAIKEIREKQASHEAIAEAKQLIEQQRKRVAEEVKKIESAQPEPQEKPTPAKIEKGRSVFWKKQNSVGTITAVQDNKVLLQVENLKFWVPKEELAETKKQPEKAKPATSVKIDTTPKSEFLPQIDLRGETLDEAIASVDKFLDDAIVAGWNQVRIIHGKGTGVLRKGISEYLEKHSKVKNQKMGAWNEGDIGVTIVDLL